MSEFFSQAGFGFYIWWSYGATVALIFAEWLVASVQGKAVLKKIQRISRMQETQGKLRP